MSGIIDEILKKHQQGVVIVYTGNGKGKTTASLGQALRAIGHGKKVFILQFMKGKETGEKKVANDIPLLEIVSCSEKLNLVNGKPSAQDITEAKQGFQKAQQAIDDGYYDMVILDEINIATVSYTHLTLPTKRIV